MDGDDDEIRDMAVPRKNSSGGAGRGGGGGLLGLHGVMESWEIEQTVWESHEIFFSFEKSWDFHKLHS